MSAKSTKTIHLSKILTASSGARGAIAKVAGKYRSRLFISVITLSVLALAVLSLNLLSRRPGTFAGNNVVSGGAPGRLAPSGLEAEVIVLRDRGFEPSEITRPAGPFLLAVDTRIGAKDADLVLSQVGGGKMREQKLPSGRRAWREQVDLPPGQYVLTVADRPDAICAITIKPR